MPLPPRFAPPTQLDALRALLAGYSEGDRTFLTQLRRNVQVLRQQALPVLGSVLLDGEAPASLKRAVLLLVATHDWPDWATPLTRMLLVEENLVLVEEACKALASLCCRPALEGLEQVRDLRPSADVQALLLRELEGYKPDAAADVCLERVLLGAEDPEQVRRGAQALATLAGPEHLSGFMQAFDQGDELCRHRVLPLLAFVEDPSSNSLLLYLFQETLNQRADLVAMEEWLPSLKGIPREAARDRLSTRLLERLTPRQPKASEWMKKLNDPGKPDPPTAELLLGAVKGPLESFAAQGYLLLREGKFATFHESLARTQQGLDGELKRRDAALEDLAGLLAAKVEGGQLPLEDALPGLELAYLAEVGGDGVAVAYLRLVPWDDAPRLDQVLADKSPARRTRAVEILGAREEDRLLKTFLRLVNDPVREISQLATRQVAKLPSGIVAMMDLFRSGHPEQMRQAIRFFEENRSQAAIKPLMGFLASEAADDLVVDAVNALGAIGDPACTNALLNQLHNGKPLALQVALVEALGRLANPVASQGLLKRAESLLFGQVLVRTLEGALAPFPGFDRPFPREQLPALEALFQRCCEAREGESHLIWVSQVIQDLYAFDPGPYERIIQTFEAQLAEHRRPSREVQEKLGECIKKLSRRVTNLASIEDREKPLQGLLKIVPAAGPERLETLVQLREALKDAERLFSDTFGQTLSQWVRQELERTPQSVPDYVQLCDIAVQAGQKVLVEPLRELMERAPHPSVRIAARRALLGLGLTEKELLQRVPIQRILLLEPNAFFRKRLQPALEGPGRTLLLASTRAEAVTLLVQGPVDLLISERMDGAEDLGPWLERCWKERACRYVVVSTSSHDPGFLDGRPWVIGRLFKPYPIQDLSRLIQA